MSVMIDEDPAKARRVGLADGFADGADGDRAGTWRRLWFTLGALIIYRIGCYLPIPGLDLAAARRFQHIASFIGGPSIPDQSILSLGIMPYISAFIIVQLVSRVVPRLRRLATEGGAGRSRVNHYARILTIALAALQAVGVATAFESVPGLVVVPDYLFEATTALALVAGAIFLMWLAEQIMVRGLGSGALVVLACSIVSELPFAMGEFVRIGYLEGSWLLAALLLPAPVVALVVVVERAMRRIPVHDPGGEVGIGGGAGGYAHLPLRLNPTGVVAPLAASLLATPVWGLILSLGGAYAGMSLMSRLANAGIGHLLVNGLLIALFAVFFGLATFDPEGIAKKLKDSGGWIPGFRPGENAAGYLRRMQVAFALVGAIYLVVCGCCRNSSTAICRYRWADSNSFWWRGSWCASSIRYARM